MRIAVTYKDGEIFEHFGHCECFAIYEYGDEGGSCGCGGGCHDDEGGCCCH